MKIFCLIFIIVICISNLFAQVNIDSGLLAYYPFNGDANDESGNENHGIINGPVLTMDRFGNDSSAYEFDGSSSYISIPNSQTLQSPSNELSQVAWINIYSWSLVGTQFGPILMKSNTGTNAFQYRMSVGSTGVNTAINNWSNAVTISDTLNFNEWYMIASTLKDDTIKAYVNGVFIGEGTLTGPISPDSSPLEIGRDVPGVTEIFHGKIDDVRIYNRALKQQEIDSLFKVNPTSINITDLDIPMVFELNQNYPNPFNPSTNISYSILKSDYISLKVYDNLGKEVRTIFNDYQNRGTYSIDFNASGLSSGIYYYTLHGSKKFSETKKMLLLR